jgi:outer membrane lipoprotein carrier protein
MRTFLSVFILAFVSLISYSQDDKAAVSILDKFSQLARNAPSISMKFDLETIDQVEGTNSTVSGSIIISNDKYMLDMKDNTIWFNGETSWSYLPAEKEVTIAKPDKNDNSFVSKPSLIFSIYKKGYKTRLLEEKADSYLIDLYPEALDSDHVRIRISIGKPLLDLKSIEYK